MELKSKPAMQKGSMVRYAVVVAVVIMLFTLPVWAGNYPYVITLGIMMGVYVTLGHMWNLLAGYSGLVSLGLQMYIGVGAYTVAMFTDKFGMPLALGLIMGGVVSTVISIGLSYLLLRMRGMYFAIATWMFTEAMRLILISMEYFGKGQGPFIPEARKLTPTDIYMFSTILVVATTVLVVLLMRSKLGLGLFAIRDNDVAASTSGVPLFRTKLMCMMVSAFVTGVCGGVYYTWQYWVQPNAAFGINWTVAAVFIVVIGGIGTIFGPIVGGIIYVFLNQYLATLTWMGSLNMVLLGGIAVAVILAAPKGIVGTTQLRLGFEVISTRRWMKAYTDRLPDPATK